MILLLPACGKVDPILGTYFSNFVTTSYTCPWKIYDKRYLGLVVDKTIWEYTLSQCNNYTQEGYLCDKTLLLASSNDGYNFIGSFEEFGFKQNVSVDIVYEVDKGAALISGTLDVEATRIYPPYNKCTEQDTFEGGIVILQ